MFRAWAGATCVLIIASSQKPLTRTSWAAARRGAGAAPRAVSRAEMLRSSKLLPPAPRSLLRSSGAGAAPLEAEPHVALRPMTEQEQLADALLSASFERSTGRAAVDPRAVLHRWRFGSTTASATNQCAVSAHRLVIRGLSGVNSFLDGLVTYVLSREWHDMFSIYIFRLQPVPHCSAELGVRAGFFGLVQIRPLVNTHVLQGTAAPTCHPEAPADEQVRCVGILIAIAAVVHALAQRSLSAEVAHAVTSIAGTTVGWAAGDAALRLLRESAPSAVLDAMSDGTGGEGFALAFALATTLACLVALLLIRPFVVHALVALLHRVGEHACGAGSRMVEGVMDVFEESLLAITKLAGRAVTMVVLMVWTYVSQLILVRELSRTRACAHAHMRTRTHAHTIHTQHTRIRTHTYTPHTYTTHTHHAHTHTTHTHTTHTHTPRTHTSWPVSSCRREL